MTSLEGGEQKLTTKAYFCSPFSVVSVVLCHTLHFGDEGRLRFYFQRVYNTVYRWCTTQEELAQPR